MVSPKNIGTSNIIRTEKVIFRNLYVRIYTNMNVTKINGVKEAMNLKERKKGYIGVS